jgi:hypothetical protein
MTRIDRRLYFGTTARLAKKHIWGLRKLQYALNLKPGDLLSTCKGYNERIAEMTPVWSNYGLRHGRYICDFDFVSETGCSCSAMHCCSFPLETRDQIYKSWRQSHGIAGCETFVCYAQRIEEVRAAGGHAFDEDGQPYYEFCLHDWEKSIRFPERWKQDVEENLGDIVKRFFLGGIDNIFRPSASQLSFILPEEELKLRLKNIPDCDAIFDRITWGR